MGAVSIKYIKVSMDKLNPEIIEIKKTVAFSDRLCRPVTWIRFPARTLTETLHHTWPTDLATRQTVGRNVKYDNC